MKIRALTHQAGPQRTTTDKSRLIKQCASPHVFLLKVALERGTKPEADGQLTADMRVSNVPA